MDVRAATMDDGPDILDMSRALHAATKSDRHFAFDPEDTALFIATCIEGGGAFVAVESEATVGALLGGIVHPPFKRAFSFAQEFVLWVLPKSRKAGVASKLLAAFEGWARAQKADAVVLGFTHGCSESAIGRMAKRRGMSPMETIYSKRLEAR